MNTMDKIIKFLCIIVCIVMVIELIVQQKRINELNQRKLEIAQEIAGLENEKISLEQDIPLLNKPEYIEKKAREKLGYIKKNEVIFVTPD